MTFRCAVLGNPIAHSKSPGIHARLAARYGLDLQYDKILVPDGDFASIVQTFFASGGRGLNVTVPCKQLAAALAEVKTPYVQCAGAANTLWMENAQLHADNTDGRGLIHALTQVHHLTLAKQRIALIGAGGATRGVVLPLLESLPQQLDIFNRSVDKAQAIIAAHDSLSAVPMRAYALDAAPNTGYDLIINATSTGLSNAELPLAPALIADTQTTAVYDMVYGRETPFLRWAKRHGIAEARCFDGKSMLEAQAELSFHIWFKQEISAARHE